MQNANPTNSTTKVAWLADGGVGLARVLLLAVVVLMLVSVSASVIVEVVCYLAFALAPALRRRLVATLRHPALLAAAPLAIVIAIGTLYGPASWVTALSSLFAWRRMLLLPLALAVFDDEAAKRSVLRVLVCTGVVGTLASFVTAWDGIILTRRLYLGVVFNNYATQGLVLSIASAVCIAALLRPQLFAADWLLRRRWAMAVSAALMLFDIVFVLEGRTGYVAVVVMTVALIVLMTPAAWRTKLLAGGAALICLALALVASPHVRDRVAVAVQQIETVDQSPQATSLGQRVVSWRTTLRLIRDHPLFGVGTGGFQDGYRPYVTGVRGWQGDETGDPHNQFLKFQSEQGLVGLAAFLFLIVRSLAYPAPSPWRELAAAVLLGWCATSLANSDFSTHIEGRLIFFWLGAMLAGPSAAPKPAAA